MCWLLVLVRALFGRGKLRKGVVPEWNSTLAKEPKASMRFIVLLSDRRLPPVLFVEGISG